MLIGPRQVGKTTLVRQLIQHQLPAGWNTPVRTTELQVYLGEWLKGTQELAVALPSAVVPFSTNLILHRTHPAFEQVKVESIQPFTVYQLWQ